MVRILITGANGFIGKNIAESLIEHELTFLIRPGKESDSLKGKIIHWDSIKGEFDIIIHAAGPLGSTGRDQSFHVEGTKRILDFCTGEKLVYISSAGVLGPGIELDENSLYNPTNEYERQKMKAEKLVKQYKNYVILRPEFVYGPQDMHLLGLFRAIKSGWFFVVGNGSVHPTYVGDVVEAIRACFNVKNEVFNIAGERSLYVREFYEICAGIMGVRVNKFKIPVWCVKLASYVPFSPLTASRIDFFTRRVSLDTSKARRKLGFKPLELEEGLKKTLECYEKVGLI